MKRFLCALIVLVCCVFAAACAAAAQETSHAHVWEETAVWREPTCTEAGELLRICSVCSLSERIPIPARGHETGDWLHDDTAKNGRKPLRIIFRTEYAPSAAQALAPAARRKDIRTAMSGSKKSPQAVQRTASSSWSVPSAARKALKRSRRPSMKRTAGNGIQHSIGTSARSAAGQRMRSRTAFWAGTSARSAGQSALPRAASGIRTTGTKGRSPTPHLYADGDARPHLPRLRHHANGRDPRSRSRFYGDV